MQKSWSRTLPKIHVFIDIPVVSTDPHPDATPSPSRVKASHAVGVGTDSEIARSPEKRTRAADESDGPCMPVETVLEVDVTGEAGCVWTDRCRK